MRTTNFLLISSFLVFVACGQGTDFIPIPNPKPPSPTPSCSPQPVAESQDLMLVLGLGMPKSMQIGAPAVAGSKYSWASDASLNRNDVAQPTAAPQKTTSYQLTVSNACGEAKAGVVVHVYAEGVNEEGEE